jgi:ferredoxin
MRVEVDTDQCEANGICEGIAPKMFHLGDRHDVEITQDTVPPTLETAVESAVAQCPKAALRLRK